MISKRIKTIIRRLQMVQRGAVIDAFTSWQRTGIEDDPHHPVFLCTFWFVVTTLRHFKVHLTHFVLQLHYGRRIFFEAKWLVALRLSWMIFITKLFFAPFIWVHCTYNETFYVQLGFCRYLRNIADFYHCFWNFYKFSLQKFIWKTKTNRIL